MNENNFIYKPLKIVQDARLTPLQQDYLCLIAQLEKAGGCTASNNYFADYFKVSRPRAVEVIGSLRKKGFIESSEQKQGGKTVKRTIWIIDGNSKEALLSDSKKSPARIVRKSGFDSKESPHHTIETTTDNKYSPNSIEYGLADLLLQEILKRKPDFKKPNLEQWEKHIDSMIRIDNRKPEIIEKVIIWCQADCGDGGKWKGWQNNILSTATLREKFDKLELAISKTQKPKTEKAPLCFVCKAPTKFAISSGKGGLFVCIECRKLLNEAPPYKNHKGVIISKHKLEPAQLEAMIGKQKAAR